MLDAVTQTDLLERSHRACSSFGSGDTEYASGNSTLRQAGHRRKPG